MSFFELDDTTIYLAAIIGGLTGALRSLDDVAPRCDLNPVRGVRQWHDGTGKTITVNPDGRTYYAGEFIGYRDAHGRITNGSGSLIVTLTDSGQYFAANGDYMGRWGAFSLRQFQCAGPRQTWRLWFEDAQPWGSGGIPICI